MSFMPFWIKINIFGQNRVHQVNTSQTISTGIQNEFQAISDQSPSGQYESNHVNRDKK
jgi:hypothetical protein